MCTLKVKTLFLVMEWTIFLSLTAIAIGITWEVFLKYDSLDSTFKRKEIPITQIPTFSMCLDPPHGNFSYEKDFHIERYFSYQDYLNHNGKKLALTNEFFRNVAVSVTEITTVYKGKCYIMHSAKVDEVLGPQGYGVIAIKFNESIPIEDLPVLEFYLTSEINSYGILRSAWLDGDAVYFRVSPKQVYMDIGIREKRYKFLKNKVECRQEPFYRCYGKALLNADFSECNETCLPHSMPQSWMNESIIPLCETDTKAMNCSKNLAYNLKTKIMETDQCNDRTCSTIEYSGKVVSAEVSEKHQHITVVSYFFLPPGSVIVFEEYLIYDFVGMLGSVGGTLGMCIGFSFVGLASFLMIHLKTLMKYLKFKIEPEENNQEDGRLNAETQVDLDKDILESHILLLQDRISVLEGKNKSNFEYNEKCPIMF